MDNTMKYPGYEDNKMNAHKKVVLDAYKKTMDSDGEDVEDLRNAKPNDSGRKADGPIDGPLMQWTELLEAMSELELGIDNKIGADAADPMNDQVGGNNTESIGDDSAILDKLNKLFTPILVMQSYEGDTKDKILEAMDNASVLTEQNIIKFDNATRMAQLISTCAILLQQQKNTEKYRMYVKAAAIRNKMKIEMQKEEYEAAKALAQKYLVMVSTKNNSPIARNAANELLPETQH